MLELKAFVQEAVHELDGTQLQLLSDTLRVDLRGCDDRKDVERILTGLLCLDKDTALGTFLTWLRTRERSTQQSGALVAKKNGFATTFVPIISPRRAGSARKSNNEENQVKEHHLTDEIKLRLEELILLEADFKEAERSVHNGSPTFEKLKAFLVKLTKLRSKEEEVRRYFIKQSQILTEQHAQMKEETLHTREQLDFFVDGFTNLRKRHDELLDKSTHMKAENEVAQDIFISITAQESHFGEILHRTLLHQLQEKRVLTDQLEKANSDIQQLRKKQEELEQLISRLKQQRGDALKDASSYKLQLRKTKQKMERMAVDGPDCAFFRQQAIHLRGCLMTLIGLFRESILRDTKSAKQSMSKEILKTIQGTLLSIPLSQSPRGGSSKAVRVAGAAEFDVSAVDRKVARVVEKKAVIAQDIDQVMRGVALLGGQDGEAEMCAALLSAKLKYAPVDVKKILEQVRKETLLESQRATQALMSGMVETGTAVPITTSVPLSTPAPATIENYLIPLKSALSRHQRERGARGFVFYNCELSAREVSLLIGEGVPVDSIIELKTPPPPPPPTPLVKAPVATPATSKSGARTTTASSKAPTSPTRGTASGSRPGAKPATPSSPSKPGSRQPTTETKRSTPATPATPATTRPIASSSSPVKPAKPKIDRKAVFAGMPQAFAQLEPVTFVDDRVDQILDVLTRQKQQKETPYVAWDDDTSQLNESLLMYAEDLHMMLWVELENRKPKKPGQDSPTKPLTPASSSSSSKTGGSSSPTRAGAKVTTKAPAKAPAKGKAASPTRPVASPSKAPAKASSPAKSPAKAKPSSPSKPTAKSTSQATSPNKPTNSPAKPSPSPPKKAASSPDKRKAA